MCKPQNPFASWQFYIETVWFDGQNILYTAYYVRTPAGEWLTYLQATTNSNISAMSGAPPDDNDVRAISYNDLPDAIRVKIQGNPI